MSQIREQIELTPPTNGHLQEDMMGRKCECSVCHGEGWYWMEDPVNTESRKNKCSYCDGTGYLVPYIFIRWGAPIRSEE